MSITYKPVKEYKPFSRFVNGLCDICEESILECICNGDTEAEECETCYELTTECLCDVVQKWDNW